MPVAGEVHLPLPQCEDVAPLICRVCEGAFRLQKTRLTKVTHCLWLGRYIFRFPQCEDVAPPIVSFVDVAFGYPKGPTLYHDLNFGLDMGSRFAIVGPNGECFTPISLRRRTWVQVYAVRFAI
jgi:ABC-type multidrug transport system fused ATPase/permease subunit